MNGTSSPRGTSWSTRLLVALVLLLVGAAAATWGLAHYQTAAKFLGVTPPPEQLTPKPLALSAPPAPQPAPAPPPTNAQIADIQARLARVEGAEQRAEGFAGRADALVVAFAARRAIDRGVALGYLEPLLVDRFGAQHQQAVGTIISSARQPIGLNDLAAEYETLGPALRRGGAQDSWWTSFQRELGSLVEVHSAQRPARQRSPTAQIWLAVSAVQLGCRHAPRCCSRSRGRTPRPRSSPDPPRRPRSPGCTSRPPHTPCPPRTGSP